MPDYTSEQDAEILSGREKGISYHDLAAALHRSEGAVKKRYHKLRGARDRPAPGRGAGAAIPVGEFVAKNDPATKTRLALRRGVRELREGYVVKDHDFCKEVGGVPGCWRHVSSEKEFAKYQYVLDGKYYWAPPATVRSVLQQVPKAKAVEP